MYEVSATIPAMKYIPFYIISSLEEENTGALFFFIYFFHIWKVSAVVLLNSYGNQIYLLFT